MKVLIRGALAIVVSSLLFTAQGAVAADVWLVNTRNAPHCGSLAAAHSGICFSRCDAGKWNVADRASFLASSDPAVPTVVFIHGNRTDNNWAVTEAMSIFPHLQKSAANKPFRYVIWSWPSELAEKRQRADVRLKSVYSDADALYLAELVREVDPQVRVSMIGYSLGARVIAGGLHLLAGGQVAGRSLDPPDIVKRVPMRAVLIAAAIDQDAFTSNGDFALAPTTADRILVTVNERDRALKWYPRLYQRGGPSAMGHLGPLVCGGSDSIKSFEITDCVGPRHNWNTYACCIKLSNILGGYMFLGD